jgi:hypothetical protein
MPRQYKSNHNCNRVFLAFSSMSLNSLSRQKVYTNVIVSLKVHFKKFLKLSLLHYFIEMSV